MKAAKKQTVTTGWYYAKDGSVKTVKYFGVVKTITGKLPDSIGFSKVA